MNPGEKAHQGLMTPNSCVEISPRKFNIFPIDLILKVIVILICFSPRLQSSLHTPQTLVSVYFSCGHFQTFFSQCVLVPLGIWLNSGAKTGSVHFLPKLISTAVVALLGAGMIYRGSTFVKINKNQDQVPSALPHNGKSF